MGVDFGFEKEMMQLIDKFNLENKILIIKNPPRRMLLLLMVQVNSNSSVCMGIISISTIGIICFQKTSNFN